MSTNSASRTKTEVDGSWTGCLSRKNLRALKTIMMRNDSIQGFDIHGEDEFIGARKINVLKDVESMFGILDVGR